MPVDIVEANPDMCEEISHLLVRSISESCFEDHQNDPNRLEPWLKNKTPENVKSWLEVNRTYCAISQSGAIVGVLQINTENRILLNYVDPSYSNKGIGTKLLRKLESDIGEGEKVVVESTETAKPFYIKSGFIELGNQPNEMSKRISL